MLSQHTKPKLRELFSSELIEFNDEGIHNYIQNFFNKKLHKVYSFYSTVENDKQLAEKFFTWLQKNPLIWKNCHVSEELNLILKFVIPYFLMKHQSHYLSKEGFFSQETTRASEVVKLPNNLYNLYSAIVTGLCFDHLWKTDEWKNSQDKFNLSTYAIKSLFSPVLSQLKAMAVNTYFAIKLDPDYQRSVSYTIETPGQGRKKENIEISACQNSDFIISYLHSSNLRTFFATEFFCQKLCVDETYWKIVEEKAFDTHYYPIWQMLAGMLHSLTNSQNGQPKKMISQLLQSLAKFIPENEGKYSFLLSVWQEAGSRIEVLNEELLNYFKTEDIFLSNTQSNDNNSKQFSAEWPQMEKPQFNYISLRRSM